ncbi:MAG: LCP family protein [Patescibacteria group bacterium]|jgi:LCP family protein required for cell wall assembly
MNNNHQDQQHAPAPRQTEAAPSRLNIRKYLTSRNIFIAAGIIVAVFILVSFRLHQTFSIINKNSGKYSQLILKYLPPKEDNYEEHNRIDVLLLGMRGKDDPNGGMLTDSMIVASYDTETKKTAMISVPRDMYVRITPEIKDKINSTYVHGEKIEKGFGLPLTKMVVGYVLGIDIDYAVLIDFDGFEELIDTIGGIDVTTNHAVLETEQWQGMTISFPKGRNHLTGEQALFYTRARYQSSDFDRAERQQEVLFGLKDKLFSLGVMANPIKINGILALIEENVTIDMDKQTLYELTSVARAVSRQDIKRVVLRNGDDGLLYNTTINGAYVLLPRGDSFVRIRELARTLFNNQ